MTGSNQRAMSGRLFTANCARSERLALELPRIRSPKAIEFAQDC